MVLVSLTCLVVVPLAVGMPQGGNAQDTLPPDLVAVRALIDSNKIQEAIRLAERYAARHSHDPRGFVAVGEAYAARMPSGRFRAFRAFREAERLDPKNAEIPYRMAHLGLWLGGADGERIAHDGLERVIALNPLYKDAWRDWLTLYRNSGSRSAMIKRLTPFADQAEVKSRLALLYIEEEAYSRADSLLEAAVAGDSTNVTWLALLAQSTLEQGDTVRGFRAYDAALRQAHRDSGDVLWRQIVGIATPDETRAWGAGVGPAYKAGWIRSFWARRHPNLFAEVNGRILEHFQRLRYARRMYPLLHPLLSYHRSALGRTLSLEPSRGERAWNLRCEVYQGLAPSSSLNVQSAGAGRVQERMRVFGGTLGHLTDDEKRSVERATLLALQRGDVLPVKIQRALTEEGPAAFAPTLFAPLGLDLRSVDTTAARIGYNLITGLSDRGLMYLRFGPPDRLLLGGDNPADPRCNNTEVERWGYYRWGEVRFAKPSALDDGRSLPETVFRPMNEDQFEVMELGLTRDATAKQAPLDFGAWTVQFRNLWNPASTDLVVATTRGAVAVTLVGVVGGERRVHQEPKGVATLTDAPGEYLLAVHAQEDGVLGRLRLLVQLRDFSGGPTMADLLLVTAWADTSPTRSGMLERIDRALVFHTDDTLRVYTELYGSANDSRARYRAAYSLLKTDDPMGDILRETWPHAVRFEFLRERRVEGEVITEWMDIDPHWIQQGTYLLRVETFDAHTGRRIGRAGISFEVRSRS